MTVSESTHSMTLDQSQPRACDEHTALITNEGNYTIFSFGDTRLKFIAPYSLEYYDSVKQWKYGYLVVMAKYWHQKEPEEEYIDLIPVLEALMMDQDDFLNQIDQVEVAYA